MIQSDRALTDSQARTLLRGLREEVTRLAGQILHARPSGHEGGAMFPSNSSRREPVEGQFAPGFHPLQVVFLSEVRVVQAVAQEDVDDLPRYPPATRAPRQSRFELQRVGI